MADDVSARYFQQPDLWRAPVREQVAVASDLIEMIPADVRSILDAGCGNGAVTNRLVGTWDVVGCDISAAAMQHVTAPTFVADLTSIPKPDKAYDLVLASDVIEHLPDAIYTTALQEIARVARRYILVAVPYQELLEHAEVTCPTCQHRYHAHHHQRSYTFEALADSPFPGFKPTSARLSGGRWMFGNSSLLNAARSSTELDYPFENAICPKCNTKRGTVKRTPEADELFRRFESLQAMLSANGHLAIPARSEVLMLFERKPKTSSRLTAPADTAGRQIAGAVIKVDDLRAHSDPILYPDAPLLLQTPGPDVILCLPRRASAIEIVRGSVAEVLVYDHVREQYVTCERTRQNRFEVPLRPMGAHGTILRLEGATHGLALKPTKPADLAKSTILAACFGEASVMHELRARLAVVVQANERLEDNRRALEQLLAKRDTDITSMSSRLTTVFESMAALETLRSSLESDISRLESNSRSLESNVLKANGAAERLEHERAALEGKLAQAHATMVDLETRLAASHALDESLEAERSRLEQQLSTTSARFEGELSKRDADTVAAERRLTAALDATAALETTRADLERTVQRLDTSTRDIETKLSQAQSNAAALEHERALLEGQLASAHQAMNGLEARLAASHALAETLETERSRLDEELRSTSTRFEAELAKRDADMAAAGARLTAALNATATLETTRADLERNAQRLGSTTRVVEDKLALSQSNAAALEQERAHLEGQLSAAHSGLAGLEAQLSASHALAKALETERARLEEQLNSASVRFESELTRRDAGLVATEARLTAALSATATLETTRADLERTVQRLGSTTHDVEIKLAQAQNNAAALEQERAHLESQLGASHAAAADLEARLAASHALADTLETERARLEEQLNSTSVRFEGELAKRDAGLAAAESRLTEALNAAAALETTRADLERTVQRLDTHAAAVSTRLSETQDVAAKLENRRTHLEETVRATQTTSSELEKQLTSANRLAADLERERDSLERKIGVRDSELSALNERLTQSNTVAAALETSRAHLEAEIARLASSSSAAEMRLTKSLELISHLELTRTDLEAQVESKHAYADALEHRLDAANALSADLEAKRVTLEEHVVSIQGTLASLQQRYTETSTTAERIEAERFRLTQSVLDLQQSVTAHERRARVARITSQADAYESADTPKRILVLSNMYPRDHSPSSGIFVHEQVKQLRAKGLDVRVMSGEPFWINTLKPGPVLHAVRVWWSMGNYGWDDLDGVPVLKFPYIVSSEFMTFDWHASTYSRAAVRALRRLAVPFDIDLIHAHTSYLDGTAGAAIANSRGVPLVITEHTGPFTLLTGTPYRRRRTQATLSASQQVLAVSRSLLADMEREVSLKAPASPQVLPNLVDADAFPAHPPAERATINALWVGHFVPVKRVDVLLRAFASAHQREPRLRLRLVGDGELENDCRQLAAELGLAEVVDFAGRADRSELVGHYRDTDFLVISSLSETFGVVAIEALSSGRPVLTTRCGGPTEVITEAALGEVVDHDEGSLADGFLKMAERLPTFDHNLLHDVVAHRYSGPLVAAKLIACYATVAARYRAAAGSR